MAKIIYQNKLYKGEQIQTEFKNKFTHVKQRDLD